MTRERRMISGRVPTMVATFIAFPPGFGREHRQVIRVGMLGVEDLAGVEERDQLARHRRSRCCGCSPGGMSRTRKSRPSTRYSVTVPTADVAKADDRLAFHHQELLGLGVVVVVPAGDPRRRSGYEDLSKSWLLQHLREGAPIVDRSAESVEEVGVRQIRQVGGVETPGERISEVRSYQGVSSARERTG